MRDMPPMCYVCIHVHQGEGWSCAAFPGGIPAKIIDWRADHRSPIPGDHGIRFEQDPKEQPYDFELFGRMRS